MKYQFQIKINTDNSAFRDPYTGDYDAVSESCEILRILKDVTEKMEIQIGYNGYVDYMVLRDINGNSVGELKFRPQR